MSDLLFELGSEELPARFVNPAARELRERVVEALDGARLFHGAAREYGTPRRIAVLVEGVADRQADLEREAVGPAAKAAFDEGGKPTKAAEGFARGQGVDIAALVRIQTPRGEYVAVRVREPGRPAAAVLPGLLESAMRKIAFPKAMRWGAQDVTWARPLQWICALYGRTPLSVRYGDVASGGATRGHRFLDPAPVALDEPAAYPARLREAHVLADFGERRARVLALAEEAAAKTGGALVLDDSLLDQVANLVEWPVAIAGSFDPGNLTLPREVLLSEMNGHQRYFAVAGADGSLRPAFVAVSATPVADASLARHGYERVLRARLADARFFFDEDRKVPIESRVEALGAVVFQQKLGTSLEKVERFGKIAEWLAAEVKLPPEETAAVRRAARLCKADLTTGMVGEFPELQGVMGREYARAGGEPPEVAAAIEEHYLPRFSGDRLPASRAGAIVGVADRLDTICGLFGIGKPPTGAADPFGLRRACLGIIHVTLARGLRFPLGRAIDRAIELLGSKLTVPAADVRAQVLAFFGARLSALWSEEFDLDLVTAVLAAGFDDLWAARERLAALAAIHGSPEFLPLAAAFKRAVNILVKSAEKDEKMAALLAGEGRARPKDGPLDRVDHEKLAEEAERALYKAALTARRKVEEAVERDDYSVALREVTALKPAIDLFFDKVLVMAEEPAVRHNRILLLAALRELFAAVADLSQIQTPHEGAAPAPPAVVAKDAAK